MTTHFKTFIFVAGVGLGIVVGEVSRFSSEVAVGALVFAVIQGIVMVVGKWRGAVGTAPLLVMLFSVGLFLGIIRVQLVEEKVSYVCASSCTYEAKTVSSPETKNDYQVFNVHPVGTETLDVQLRTPLYPKYEIGETLKISGKVLVPDVIPPHGGQKSFDYASYLLTKNVGSEMMFPHIEVLDVDAHTLTEVLGRWKENMIEKINLYISSPAASLASGMLFGNSSMSKELTQTFRVAGLSHIIVLSGFNIAVVISFILFVFAFLPILLRIGLASISVIFFVMMVGGEASVIRATLMAFIALLATLVGREYMAKQALIISLLLIVLYEPYALLHDVSLHLSFLATFGIVYVSEYMQRIIEKYFHFIHSESLIALLVTTLSAYLVTLPYIMYTFGTVSVYALIANVLVLPFVPVAMLLSFLVVSSSYAVPILATGIGFIASVIINFTIFIADATERLPFAYLHLQITSLEMCLLYIGIAFAVVYAVSKTKNETAHTDENGFLTDTISY